MSRSFRAAAVLIGVALAACAGPLASRLGETRTTSLGPVLVDADGHTLYVHEEDPPGVSHCTPACTVYWPPLEATPDAVPQGGFTIITREGGARQWAYKGRPLYRFAFDLGPGRTGGDGAADGDWHVARP